MLNQVISERVLTVAADYKDYRGGIGAVVNAYSSYFLPFKFIATYPKEKTKYKLSSVPMYLVACLKLVTKLLLDRKIELVHLHCAANGSIYRKFGVFLISKYLFKRKVIFHSHGSEIKLFYENSSAEVRWMFKYFIEKVDCVICLSPEWIDFFQCKFNPKKIVLLENIVPKSCSSMINRCLETKVSFLFLGLIGNRKGVFDLMDVIINFKDQLKGNAIFYIGGNGDTEKLNELIKKFDLFDIVKFEGWVIESRKMKLLGACDVYVLPSYNEGLPISILEAMSYGLPIISTRVGGIPQVVANGKNGCLIEPGDKAALWDCIQFFIKNSDELVKMGKLSRQFVQPYYAENVIKKLELIYKDILVNN